MQFRWLKESDQQRAVVFPILCDRLIALILLRLFHPQIYCHDSIIKINSVLLGRLLPQGWAIMK